MWNVDSFQSIERIFDLSKSNQAMSSMLKINGILTFLPDHVHVLVGGGNKRPNFALLLKADDLSGDDRFDKNNPTPMQLYDNRLLMWQSGAVTSMWDSLTDRTTRVPIELKSIKSLIASQDYTSIALVTQSGSIQRCALNGANSSCETVAINAKNTFRTLSKDMFGVLMENEKIGLYGYRGGRMDFPDTEHPGNTFELNPMPDSGEILVWSEDGRVMRYRRDWAIFGKRIAWAKLAKSQ